MRDSGVFVINISFYRDSKYTNTVDNRALQVYILQVHIKLQATVCLFACFFLRNFIL